jgi:hypothetical protein
VVENLICGRRRAVELDSTLKVVVIAFIGRVKGLSLSSEALPSSDPLRLLMTISSSFQALPMSPVVFLKLLRHRDSPAVVMTTKALKARGRVLRFRGSQVRQSEEEDEVLQNLVDVPMDPPSIFASDAGST